MRASVKACSFFAKKSLTIMFCCGIVIEQGKERRMTMQKDQATVVVSKEMKWKIKEQALKEKITMIELLEKAVKEYFERL